MWKKYLKNLNLPESFVSITLGFLVVIVAGLLIFNYFSKGKEEKVAPKEEALEETLEEKRVSPFLTAHIVVENENLWVIAEKYYGSGYNWVTIASENKLSNPNFIIVSQVLNIPKAEVIRPAGEKMLATAVEPEKIYTVVQGDNLWNIAVREYGDGFAWTRIAATNNLANPDLIYTGNVLRLPR